VAQLNRPGEGGGVSMGAVWGDYDNDGYEDLFVYKWGYPQLLHNLGNGKFADVTEQSGLRHWMNSNGAVWLDFDRDGLLDLYVTGYFRSDIDFWHLRTTRIMQHSWEFATNGGKNLLFQNLGNGHFADVTDSMGVGSTRWTLAAAAADFNDDGWPDLYLANDYGPEELFLNRGGKRFELARAGLEDDSRAAWRSRWATSTTAASTTYSSPTFRRRGFCFRATTCGSISLSSWAGSKKSRAASSPTPAGRGARNSAT